MLILDKRRTLERMVSLAERAHEAVPEPFSVLFAGSFMTMPVVSAAIREKRAPMLTHPLVPAASRARRAPAGARPA